jgi:hypothetical protein
MLSNQCIVCIFAFLLNGIVFPIYSTPPEYPKFFKTGYEWRVEPFEALEERSRVFGFEEFRAKHRLLRRCALHFLSGHHMRCVLEISLIGANPFFQ